MEKERNSDCLGIFNLALFSLGKYLFPLLMVKSQQVIFIMEYQ